MDDGYIDKGALNLCTENFTYEECCQLRNLLFTFNIKNGTQSRGNSQYRLRVSTKSMDTVRALVTPYIHPFFLYKLYDNHKPKTPKG